MRETSLKLSWLVFLLVVFASYLTPFTAEARNKPKHDKNCHGHRPPTQPPTPPPTPPPTTPSPTPPPSPSPYEGFDGACGSPCFDDNDCNYPCPRCLYNNGKKTCNHDIPYFTPPTPSPSPSSPPSPTLTPSPTPSSPPLSPSPSPSQSPTPPLPSSSQSPLSPPPSSPSPSSAPGYQDWSLYANPECGSPCIDSNECVYPCYACSSNKTCGYPYYMLTPPPPPPPSPSPSIVQPPTPQLAPTSAPNNGIEVPSPSTNEDDELAPTPSDYASSGPSSYPPYQVHGCGYPCNDSNDCDGPCTNCCGNHTCCYDDQLDWPPPNFFG